MFKFKLTSDARVGHSEVPRDVSRTRTGDTQLLIADGHQTPRPGRTSSTDQLRYVGGAPDVAEVDANTPAANTHPAVAGGEDVDEISRRPAGGVEVLERTVVVGQHWTRQIRVTVTPNRSHAHH